MDVAGGLLAIAGGLSWMLLCYRDYHGMGSGDHLPLLYDTQVLFCVPLGLMGLALATCADRFRAGVAGTVALSVARVGAFVGALGAAMMSCLRMMQDGVLGDLDCGLLGASLSVVGCAMLYVGLAALGWASIATHGLGRWNVLPLVLGGVALGGVPLGHTGVVLGGDRLGQAVYAMSRGLFGLGWVVLGCLLWFTGAAWRKDPDLPGRGVSA